MKHKAVYLKYSTENELFLKEANKERQVPLRRLWVLIKKQSKITDKFVKPKWPTNSIEHKRTNKLVTQLVMSGMHLYCVVEERGFKDLIAKGFPMYSLPSRTTFSLTIIPEMYLEEKNKLRAMLEADKPSIQSHFITSDGWKSQAGDGFWSVTLRYVNGDMQIVSKALACSVISARNTAETLQFSSR